METKRKPANKARWRGSVTSRDDARPLLAAPGDVALVERGCPRSLVIKCPCGCGEELVINLDERVGPAWRLYHNALGVTLFPSVWRESGCQSHFILWDGRILMCNGDWLSQEVPEPELEHLVLAQLPLYSARAFDEIARAVGAMPWAVLACCRQLVRRGLAQEGTGRFQGWFQRRLV